MDDLSPTARAALRRYHAAAGLEEAARERVWQAIEGSIAAEPRARGRGRVVAIGAAIVGLAATVVFAVCDVRGRLADSRRAEVDAAAFATEQKQEEVAARRVAPAVVPVVSSEAPVEPPRPQRRAVTAAATKEEERGLAAEMAWLREARAAIDGGDPEAALRALAGHAQEFKNSGQMLEDRERLRIEALCRLGRGEEARAEIAAFLREHPGSTHAARVRGLCPEVP